MSQKKPTTNDQLAEMRELIANMAPGKVVSVDRELQERNATLMLILYGAVAKHGIGHPDLSDGVLVSSQVPVIQVPAEQQLEWKIAADGRSVMLYIVQTEPAEGDTDKVETSSAQGGEAATTPAATSEQPSPDLPAADDYEDYDTALPGIGDEYEDEMEVGLGD